MTTYVEASALIRSALAATDPESAYTQLISQGLDLSKLPDSEILLLISQFAGNQCVIFRGMTPSQISFARKAMAANQIPHW